ncbi:hypothetical protein ABIB07_009018, partial [Bradyrhizobium sp. RT10b]
MHRAFVEAHERPLGIGRFGIVVREELAAAPGSSGVSSRDGLEEGSDDDTQE